jgi:RHS repeat-associated protein
MLASKALIKLQVIAYLKDVETLSNDLSEMLYSFYLTGFFSDERKSGENALLGNEVKEVESCTFTSKELDDETGLYYFGARYLDPQVSRWMSADPIMDNAKKGFSVYGYGNNNPLSYTDPTGLYDIPAGKYVYQIAQEHHTTVAAIQKLNQGVDLNHTKAGQHINLPGENKIGEFFGSLFNSTGKAIANLPKNAEQGLFNLKTSFTAFCLGVKSKELHAVMKFESGESASIVNAYGATGLIQFMPNTAKDLGTTTDKLAKMSRFHQLDYVYKYLTQSKFQGRISNLGDLYLAILSGGSGMGENNNYPVFSSPHPYYNSNAALDANADGIITRGEAIAHPQQIYNELNK